MEVHSVYKIISKKNSWTVQEEIKGAANWSQIILIWKQEFIL